MENNTPVNPDKWKEEMKDELFRYLSRTSPIERQAILRKISGGNTNQNTTYYNRKYGLMLVEPLLMMYREKKVLYFPYADYPKWSHKTVYQYVQNGFKFAVDYLDNEEAELKRLREEV